MRIPQLVLLCLALATLAGCRNAPAEAREELRYEVQAASTEDVPALRSKLADTLLRGEDPHLRSAAAQGLGNIGHPGDADLLLEALLGPLADSSTQVRMECAIAVGKLIYPSRVDPRRRRVLTSLTTRVAYDRDPAGRPLETQFTVRSAMVNSLIALGGQGGAAALHDVATRLHADLTGGGAALTRATDRGLFDRCLDGLCVVTGVSRRDAATHRVANDDLATHLDWWAERIAEMPGG